MINITKIRKEMQDVLYPSRKHIYSEFEFNYLYQLKNDYIIKRQFQSVYNLTKKENGVTTIIEFKTYKNDNQYAIKEILFTIQKCKHNTNNFYNRDGIIVSVCALCGKQKDIGYNNLKDGIVIIKD